MCTTGKKRSGPRLAGMGLVLALIALGTPSSAEATSVKDLTLSQLVADADAIVRVKVSGRSVGWGRHLEQAAIVTEHAFESEHTPLLGQPLRSLTLFGGEVEGERHTLVGQPELVPGGEYLLLLIQRRAVACPLVGVWKGVFELRKGRVFQEGRPVVDVVGDEVVLGEDNEQGMSAAALEAELRSRISARAKRRASEKQEEGK